MRKTIKGKNVLIIAGGDIHKTENLLKFIKSFNFIIAANGGCVHSRKLKIKPDLIMGDFDSASLKDILKYEKPGKIKRYPAEKDSSDSELAVSYAVKKGAKNVTVIGAFGKRIDHTITNIFVAAKHPGKVTLTDKYSALTVYNKAFKVKGRKGDTISLLPFCNTLKRVSCKGFKYELNNAELSLNSLGLSNELTVENASVSFKEGKLIFIRALKK